MRRRAIRSASSLGRKRALRDEVDAERERLHRREHQLRPRPREAHQLGQRPHHEVRLPAHPELGFDPQRPRAVLDPALHPAQHVPLQRRQDGLAVALEHQRPRLVQAVHERLAQVAAEGAAHQPLQLRPGGGAGVEVVGEARVRLVGSHPRALQLGRAQQAAVAREQPAPQRRQPLARVALRGARDVGGDVALGVAQAHEEEQRRALRVELLQALRVRGDVAREVSRIPSHLLRVAAHLPAAADAHDLDVGGHRLQRAEQREEALALAVLGEPRVRAGGHRERGPAVVEVGAEHEVAVHEADRRAHARYRVPRLLVAWARTRSSAPRSSTSTCLSAVMRTAPGPL